MAGWAGSDHDDEIEGGTGVGNDRRKHFRHTEAPKGAVRHSDCIVTRERVEGAGMLKKTISGRLGGIEGWVAAYMHEEEETGGQDRVEIVRNVCWAIDRSAKVAKGKAEMPGGL